VYQHDVFHVLIDLQKNSKKIPKKFQKNSKKIPKKFQKNTKNRQKSKKKSLYDGEYASTTIFFLLPFPTTSTINGGACGSRQLGVSIVSVVVA
jgi:hypothetical protein